MPWDGTELWVGKLSEDGSLTEKEKSPAASMNRSFNRNGRRTACCTLSPTAPAGGISIAGAKTKSKRCVRWKRSLANLSGSSAARFTASHPNEQIVCTYAKNGTIILPRSTPKRKDSRFELPFSAISQVRVAGDRVVFIGASATETTSIVSLDLSTKTFEVLRRSRETTVDAGYLSDARAIEFPTEQGLTAHGYFYRAAETATSPHRQMKNRRCWS